MQGRVHPYEGYTGRSSRRFRFACSDAWECKRLLLTNAAGGINPQYDEGALVLHQRPHQFAGSQSSDGPNDDRFGPRFPDMTEAYCRAFRQTRAEAGREHGMDLHGGRLRRAGRPELRDSS